MCIFKRHLQYLGHLLSGEVIPTERKGNRTAYYRKCVANLSEIFKPLTELTKKNTTSNWNLVCQ